MADRHDNTRRLAKNTMMLYGRMLFNLVLSLFTSRMILAALGESDYGVYNVVGGVVSMFSILTSSMSTAISRFQTFELGKGETSRLRDVYSSAMWIQITFSLIAVVLVETVGVWFLNTQMTIPEDRLSAANWVLQFSTFSFVASVTATPYSASVIAHEDMGVFAWISIYETVFKFIVALLLSYAIVNADRLVCYSSLLALSSLSVQVIYRMFCKRHYEECRMCKTTDRQIYKDIFSFAGWNFVGSGAGLLTTQGVNIVLNMAFGPIVNAARGLATTVNSIISGFANNFSLALNPQIVKSYASGDMPYTIYLVERGARFAFYIFFIISLPVLMETEFLLDLWLVDVPQYTVSFVRLVIVVTMIDLFSTTLGAAQLATGKIRNYEIVVSLLQVLYFVSTAVFILCLSSSPQTVYYLSAIFSILITIARLLFVRKSLGMSLGSYCRDVYWKMLVVSFVSLLLPLALYRFVDNGSWSGFFIISIASVLSAGASCYFLGCNDGEKKFIIDAAKRVLAKFNVLRNV